MRIGFDAKRAAQNRTGLGNYSRFIIRILSESHPDNTYHLYTPKPQRIPYLKEIPTLSQLKLCFPPKGTCSRLRSLWRVWGITKCIRQDGIDLFHGLSNELPLNINPRGARATSWPKTLQVYRHRPRPHLPSYATVLSLDRPANIQLQVPQGV